MSKHMHMYSGPSLARVNRLIIDKPEDSSGVYISIPQLRPECDVRVFFSRDQDYTRAILSGGPSKHVPFIFRFDDQGHRGRSLTRLIFRSRRQSLNQLVKLSRRSTMKHCCRFMSIMMSGACGQRGDFRQ